MTKDKIKSSREQKIAIPKDENQNPNPIIQTKVTKENSTIKNSLEDQFEFNQETINFFTKDLDSRKILIKHQSFSPFLNKINDTIIICLLIKNGNFKDYHCSTPKCKVGKLWNDKPIQLILNRKNSIKHDLSISNLELICANCYMVKYGLDMFIKKKKESILTCSFCNFPLVTFKDSRKKKGVCLACEKKGNKISFENQEDNFINKLKSTYSDNPVLSDDIKKTNYYNEVSKYKKINTNYNSGSRVSDNRTTNNESTYKPIIELNMNMPDLSDLINEEE